MSITRNTPHTFNFRWDRVTGSTGTKATGGKTIKRTDTFTGSKVPGWRRVIRNGLSATSVASGTKYTVEMSGSACTSTFIGLDKKAYTVSCSGIGFASETFFDFSSTPANDPAVLNKAVGSFYHSVQDALAEFKGMTFLGEIRETLGMIRGRGKQIGRLVSNYQSAVTRAKRSMTAKKFAESIPNLYLEYTFGWVPLFLDIEAGMSSIRKAAAKAPSIRIRGYASVEGSNNDSISPYDLQTNALRGQMTIKRSTLIEEILTASLVFPKDHFSSAAQFGFDPSEFVPTVWELFPYSFLVDYFANIDDIISAYSAPAIKLQYLNRTTRLTSSNVFQFGGHSGKGIVGWQHSNTAQQTATLKAVSFDRSSYLNLLKPPTLAFTLPSPGHMINIAALAGAFFTRR